MNLCGIISSVDRYGAVEVWNCAVLLVVLTGMELVGKSKRRFTTAVFKSFEISMGLLAILCAYLLRHWSYFQACLAAPCVILFIGYL